MFRAPPHRPPIVVPAPWRMPVLLGWLGRTGLSACIRLGSLMHGYGKTAAPRCTPAFPGRAMAPLRLISLPSLARRVGCGPVYPARLWGFGTIFTKNPAKTPICFRTFPRFVTQACQHRVPLPTGSLQDGTQRFFFYNETRKISENLPGLCMS